MQINQLRNNNGFTLIEIIIYVAIIGIVMTSFIAFGMSISSARSKTYVVQEVQGNARMLIDIISQKIKRAQAITSPTAGQSNGAMTLDMPYSESDLTFSMTDGIVYLTEGSGDPQAIVSNEVEVENFQFSNIGLNGSVDSILVEFDMEFRNAASVEYSYADSFCFVITSRY